MTEKRCLTKQEAADYCGCKTLAAFDSWLQKGIVPKAIQGTNRWDRKALDAALDRASGLVTDFETELTPYQRWKAENARKTQAA
ncbi:hypothetical protein QA645_19410 [Bradyrhizobium sp. CIAT3101]|uniref:hypothetical protein n=1 Tax=Bradyrhizobium sp. CIAT3101 TaxID=439387 RepID=UPI0024B23CBF|nr:hypothetical protein [Bradyrhizobium sp. CIAT3101]WFU84824.1 hypothetical protein QA645_19410 [Bradyrhizobium sp. CIAT3101]